MKINDVVNENYYGDTRNNEQGRKIYVDELAKQIIGYIDSIRKSNQPLKMWDFVGSYLTKNRWTASPVQTNMLKQISTEIEDEYNMFAKQNKQDPSAPGAKAFDNMASQLNPNQNSGGNAFGNMASQLSAPKQNWAPSAGSPAVWKSNRTNQPMNEGILGDLGQWARTKAGAMATSLLGNLGLSAVNKLANAMYTVGSTQTGARVGGNTRPAAGTVDNPVLAKNTQQVINTVKNMKGEDYKDDLESIVRLALGNLYKTDPADYNTEIKRIMGQKPTSTVTPAAQSQDDNPNIVRGSNE